MSFASSLFDEATINVINAIGTNELDAAKMVMKNLEHSSDYHSDMMTAIGHLQSAYISFDNLSLKKGIFVTASEKKNRHKKALQIATLIAVCYKKLGNSGSVTVYVDYAKSHFDPYVEGYVADKLDRLTVAGQALTLPARGLLKKKFKKQKNQERQELNRIWEKLS